MGIFRKRRRHRDEWRTWSVLADQDPPPSYTNSPPLIQPLGRGRFERPGEVSVSIVRDTLDPDGPIDSIEVVMGGVYQRLPLDAARFLRDHLDAAVKVFEEQQVR